jgi:prepilin signal peptidase PulO-like enzyme (type II secretory pathway)
LLVNLYWSSLILAFGLCVGSFLNVIIYRWPRDLSIRRPLWSFCPRCQATLHWYDNIPVLSYVLLGGRCRYCRAPISLQYPLVELATAFSFLIIYDAFFVAKLRSGITDLANDWPILLAHWALAAGLVVVAVMDLEAYLVDIRVTWLMTAAGLVLHSLWTPFASTASDGWTRPNSIQAGVVTAAVVGLGIGALGLLRRSAAGPSEPIEPQGEPPVLDESQPVNSEGQSEELTASPSSGPRGWAVTVAACGGLLLLAYVATMLFHEHQAFARLSEPVRLIHGRLVRPPEPAIDPGLLRTAVGLLVLFVAMTVFASQPHPEEDQEIVEAIHDEAPDARRNALWELKLLAPAIVLVVAAAVLLARTDGVASRVDSVLHARAVGHWQPCLGLATALAGWVVGGGLAWATRVLGTLGLGKEALGMGDVHIMAAVGAIAGAGVAFLGFFIASPLALLGILVIHFRRQSRALPYGPWLALGSFLVVLYQDRILAILFQQASLG